MASSSYSPLRKVGSHSNLVITSKNENSRAVNYDGNEDFKESKSDQGTEDEDEDESQKRELLRLLGTATDEDRRRVVLSALSTLESKNKRIASTIGHHLLSEAIPVESHPTAGFMKSSSSHSLSSLMVNTGNATGGGSTTIAIAEGKSDFEEDDDNDERKLKSNLSFSGSSANIAMGSSGSAHRLPVVMDDYKDDLNDVYSNAANNGIYSGDKNSSSSSSSSIMGGHAMLKGDNVSGFSGNVKALAMTKAVGMGANAGSIGIGINRPMSARLRRPSLDVIPENRRFTLRTYEKGKELELEEHDINDICSSSHDPKYPPSSSLLNQHSNKIGWMSTGLFPQVMSINFSSHWVFRKVVVKCLGVESIGISVPSTANVIIPMEKLNANEFIFDIRVTTIPPQIESARKHDMEVMMSEANFLDLIWGNQVVLTFTESSSQFVAVMNLKIVVVPFIRDSSRNNNDPSRQLGK